MKVFVLLEDEQAVGVTKSKTRAESWIFSMNHDYAGPFEIEEPNLTPPHAPEVERGSTPAQNLMRNLETVDEGLTKADENLKKQLEKLEKTLKKRFKSSLLERKQNGHPREHRE